MKQMKINAPIFDMKNTVNSGQPLAFHSRYNEEMGSVFVEYSTSKGVIKVRCEGNTDSPTLFYSHSKGYTDIEVRDEICRRFGLNDDIKEIYSKINTDKFMNDAISGMEGLRVTMNDPWESTLCFVVSQFNNIKRIRGIINRLMQTYGESHYFEGNEIKLFPTPEAISKATIEELMRHGAGFRAKYIKSVAEACAEGTVLEDITKMEYDEGKQELMKLEGIGDKVADCILLFGYGRYEAFPIDTWIKRVVEKVYIKRKTSVKSIHQFAWDKWGSYAGYAQQYLFWFGRTTKVK
jgi:N-glycosylase/DNA lyase